MLKCIIQNSMKRRYFIIGSVLFITFLVYTYFVAREYLIQFDFDSTVRIQNNVPVRVDPFFSSFSLLGSFEMTSLLFGVTVLLVSWKKWRRIFLGLSFVVFHIVEIVFKTIIDQIGPPFMFHRYSFDYHFPSSYISTDYFSYPSGHIGRTSFLLAMFVFIIWKSTLTKAVKWGLSGCLGGIYIIMFVSRISLGEHWISDLIGGTLLGLSLAVYSFILW